MEGELMNRGNIKIALSSLSMRMGKSTVSDYLIEKYNFKSLVLAKTLKDMGLVLLRALEISEERIMYYTTVAKEEIIPELGVSWRWICQSIGTEWGRMLIHPDIWLKTTAIQIKDTSVNYVCDDVRFLNEASFYKDKGFVLIKIVKPDVPIVRTHSSEGELDNYVFDYTIVNDGTIEELYSKVDSIIEDIYGQG
jgi:hypothetical protein